jgi:hypothetical protein
MMTEDDEFQLLEQRLERQKKGGQWPEEAIRNIRAHEAAAEFIASQTADLLAITTLRKAFEYGYRTGFRDAKGDK